MIEKPKLSRKRQAFAEEYCKDYNGRQAAIRAGYSERTAASIACQLKKLPEVKEAIEKHMQALTMSAEEATKRMNDYANANLKPFVRLDENGNVYFDFSTPEAQENLHLVKKIKQKRKRQYYPEKDETWEIEYIEVDMHDAKDAVDKLMRAHGVYKDSVDLNVKQDIRVIDFGESEDEGE